MRKLFLTAALMSVIMSSSASAVEPDTTRVEKINEIVVVGVKAKKEAPFAVTNIKAQELNEFSKTGRELPFLFARTPGIVAWSENGLGTGTTYMRLRGAGGSRINITLDGVALNSPQDQCVFWANMNSYGSLLGSAQIQRGVGSSTNGDGAFGGSISLNSKTPQFTPSGEVNVSYGSYNTMNAGGSFSTGLLADHFIVDGAYHQTNTDGFIHGTSGYSGSYYGGLTYVNQERNLMVRYKHFGNFEQTGQAWNGVTAGNNDYSMNSYDGIKSYKDMWDAGMGRFNSLYEGFTPDWSGNWTIDRYQLSNGELWNKATDNFWQGHNLLSLAWEINPNWSTSASLHYTHGYGYYNEFRYNNKLKKFGLANFTNAAGEKVKKADFIRKKGLFQDTYGLTWNVNYMDEKWDVIGGISMQNFEGNHFGYITYTSNAELRNLLIQNGKWSTQTDEYQYYNSDAVKSDASSFLKATYHITPHLSAFGDLQFRHVRYVTNGINDKFYENADGTWRNHQLDINQRYDFLNPKVGFSYHTDLHTVYGSFALSHREPERNNFTDNGSYPAPRAERLMDYELGYAFHNDNYHVGVNAYYMNYKDQFVQTGAKSDIGESLTTNIPESHRMGIELQTGINITPWLSLELNGALSKNKLKNFDEVVETYDGDWNDMAPTIVHYDKSTLAFSPAFIGNAFLDFHYKGVSAVWHTNNVSRQYLDNTQNRNRSLPSYTVSNLTLGYSLRPQVASKSHTTVKEILFGLNLNNLFNQHYAASGWVYSAIVGNSYPVNNRYYQIGYMPMAGFNMMGSITVKF